MAKTALRIKESINRKHMMICSHIENRYIQKVFLSTKDGSKLYKNTRFDGFRDYIHLYNPICDKCFNRWKIIHALAGRNLYHIEVR